MGLRVNGICRDACNSGWMNALETAVEPILTPLINGTATVLTPEAQIQITQWVMKTAMVFELTSREPPFFTFEERDALRRGLTSANASRTIIWLCRYAGPHMSLSHGTRLKFGPTEGILFDLPALATTISLGQFLCQMLTVRLPAGFTQGLRIPTATEWETRTVRIWPPSGDASWPPPEDVDEPGYEALNKRF
jgi:hypothetical protein